MKRKLLKIYSLTGWALDDADLTAPVRVDIYADGGIVWSSEANGSRPDIATAFPGAGDAHGFTASFNLPSGGHDVCAFAINIGSGVNNPELGSRRVTTADPSPIGSLDLTSRNGVEVGFAGWVIDPDTTGPVTIVASVNGVDLQVRPADVDRPDVAAFYPGFGPNHGFSRSKPKRVFTAENAEDAEKTE